MVAKSGTEFTFIRSDGDYFQTTLDLQDLLDSQYTIPAGSRVQCVYYEDKYMSVVYKDRVYVVYRWVPVPADLRLS